MAVQIGSARADERGKATGGQAGDQNGREVSTQNWYLSDKGWVLLRPKDPAAAEKIAKAMRAACDNPLIGYDQYQRDTLYSRAKLVGFDPGAVTVACETDCSALVRVCLAHAGIMADNFRTVNQVSIVMATGAFDKLTDAMYTEREDYLRRGDVLVTQTSGHTVVVLSNGTKAGSGGRPTLRKGDNGAQVKTLQNLLLAKGYALPKYGADGDFGEETFAAVKAFQADRKLEVDGIVGVLTWAALMSGEVTLYELSGARSADRAALEAIRAQYGGTVGAVK